MTRHPLSHRQARQLMDTAYLAAATALLWIALYYLPVGSPLFRLALPLPLALLLLALMGPIRGLLVLFPYGALALWMGWCWRRGASWWWSWGLGSLIGAAGFLVRVAVLSVLVGQNLWVVITSAAAGLMEKLASLIGHSGSVDLAQVQLLALVLVLLQNVVVVLAMHAVAYWIFPRLKAPIPEPPQFLQVVVAMDPL